MAGWLVGKAARPGAATSRRVSRIMMTRPNFGSWILPSSRTNRFLSRDIARGQSSVHSLPCVSHSSSAAVSVGRTGHNGGSTSDDSICLLACLLVHSLRVACFC